jgi:hypothetical protein
MAFEHTIFEIIKETARVIDSGKVTAQDIINDPYSVVDLTSRPVVLFKYYQCPFISKNTYSLMAMEGDEWANLGTADIVNPTEIKQSQYQGEEFYILPKEQRTNQILVRLIEEGVVTDKNIFLTSVSMQDAFWYITKTNPETTSTYF